MNFTLENLYSALGFFLFYFVELSLLILAIGLFVEFLNTKYSAQIQKHLNQNTLSSYLKALCLGMITPFCSCSTIPLLRGFLRSGAGFGQSMTYLFISPLVNPIIITIFIIAFGVKLTVAYALFLSVFVLFFGFLLGKVGKDYFLRSDFVKNQGFTFSAKSCCAKSDCCEPKKSNFKGYLNASVQSYKQMFWYVIAGMFIGAFIHGFVPNDFLSTLDSSLGSISLSAFVAIFLYLRVESLVPIAVALLGSGAGMGVVMSFIIAGAGASLPELILLRSMFKKRFIFVFAAIIFLVAITFGYFI